MSVQSRGVDTGNSCIMYLEFASFWPVRGRVNCTQWAWQLQVGVAASGDGLHGLFSHCSTVYKTCKYLSHRVRTYIEGNRENLVTIWRQLFWCTASVARSRAPPHLSFPTWTSIQSQRGDPQADQWPCTTCPPPCCIHMMLCSRQDIWEGVHVGKERWGGDTSRDANMRITEYVPI